MGVAILVWYLARAFYSRGKDSHAIGFALTYMAIELLQLADRFVVIETLSYRHDLWTRSLLSSYVDPTGWHSRQAGTVLGIEIGLLPDSRCSHTLRTERFRNYEELTL